MSENPVETTATEPSASNPVPATPPVDIEAVKKSAVAEARREAQAAKDRELAKVHRQYQEQMRQLRETVRAPLQKAGYEPDAVLDDYDMRVKARQFDEISQQAQQAAEWQGYVESVATAYGLTAGDPRLADAASAQDLQAKAKAAMLADAAKEREAALKEAQAARLARAEAKVENGDLDTLGGAPAATSLSPSAKVAQAKQELSAELKKPVPDMKRITALRSVILAK